MRSTTARSTTRPDVASCSRRRGLRSVAAEPRRSVLFAFWTAEESGLRGAEYYSHHPLFPPDKNGGQYQLRRAVSVRPHARRRCNGRRAGLPPGRSCRKRRNDTNSRSLLIRGRSREATTGRITSCLLVSVSLRFASGSAAKCTARPDNYADAEFDGIQHEALPPAER